MKITIQYFDGCPHWKLADERVQSVLRGLARDDVSLEHQLIDSPEAAKRFGFHGLPTILIDGRDAVATGAEQIGISCRVYRTDEGPQGARTVSQQQKLFSPDKPA
jgi:hypothetical protein